MNEYRLIFHWDAEHWTTIHVSDTREGVCKYIDNNSEEMWDALAQTIEECGEDDYFSVVYYYNNAVKNVWHGTPDELYAYLVD